jgi:hypothetical protein
MLVVALGVIRRDAALVAEEHLHLAPVDARSQRLGGEELMHRLGGRPAGERDGESVRQRDRLVGGANESFGRLGGNGGGVG